ncbi:acyl-CoA thioesterase-2 [Sphingomonas gellani]|uniref:Acyl-CoA thioesterase 2 n=1 Tax=Sphingomonas gellani TaxID=1166340 RepID=A0A1H8ETT2_9SPHN|nr:acyl-CoA thioesterase II [Sphingomonas gellani]SEN22534.1 acyl-CoA thioesterase-2 [Sphingomonas gellani]
MSDIVHPEPAALARELIDLLDVEQVGTDLFRGGRQPGGVGRVFGGQVIAQALQAAQRSVEGKDAHSLHAYFMRPGDENFPITYQVVRDFDGRSFATRRVIATQGDQPILNLAASFQTREDGVAHQDAMPDVPAPEDLRSEAELRDVLAGRVPEGIRRYLMRARPIEIRPVNPGIWFKTEASPPRQFSWFRLVAPAPDDPDLHRAILAYASDMMLLGTSMLPHGMNWMMPGVQSASLDHALWLHEPFRADDWLLYACDSDWAGHARGLNRGRIFTRDGTLVASVAQEGLIRRRNRPGD